MEDLEIGMPDPFNGWYRGKTVFVTGHTGFKGSWLSLWLCALGARVVGYSLEPPTDPSLFEAAGLARRLEHHLGDVRDFEKMKTVMSARPPDLAFHLAAQPLVRYSHREPRLTFETNVMGTVNFLDAARSIPGRRVLIVVTSDKCYSPQEPDRVHSEEDSLGGRDPYSASKAGAELAAAAFRECYFGPSEPISAATVRAGNVIGGGDWGVDRLVPDAVRALADGRKIPIRNPRSVRPWQHVLDPIRGYLLLASRMAQSPAEFAGPWNFGPRSGASLSVEVLASRLVKAWGEGGWEVVPGQSTPGPPEAEMLKLDSSKARRLLAWEGILDIDSAVRLTVEWYRQFYKGDANMFDFSMGQIKAYASEWDRGGRRTGT